MKILIAVPTFETISAETFKSIYGLDTGEHEVAFNYVKGYDCAKARNDIGKMSVDGGFDYVLMVDSDMVLPEDALMNLLEYPVDLALGLYPHRNTKTGEIELFKPKQANFVDRFNYSEVPTTPRFKVKGGGFGCALVNVNMFKKIKFPWFKYVVYDNGNLLSEDLYFCISVGGIGGTIEADSRVRCGHLMKYFQYS